MVLRMVAMGNCSLLNDGKDVKDAEAKEKPYVTHEEHMRIEMAIPMRRLLPATFLFCLVGMVSTLDRNPCESNPCALGQCIPEGNTFRCRCDQGVIGTICDTNRVSTENCDLQGAYSCRNGGVCNTTDNVFTCVCPPNYKGKFCEEDVDECLLSPCENGGQCVNRDGDFFCMCPRGFKSKTCQQQTEVCSQWTCHNNARCIDAVDSFVCECPHGFFGRRCQFRKLQGGDAGQNTDPLPFEIAKKASAPSVVPQVSSEVLMVCSIAITVSIIVIWRVNRLEQMSRNESKPTVWILPSHIDCKEVEVLPLNDINGNQCYAIRTQTFNV
ncbi:hypothetical protein Q1695_002867 [Nippostrongylus brasiliensis]|nr:hypothetical protein Q1695_002867 [Nippostrongylus brasiliensis]